MAASSNPVSPVSLNQLPRPYDISAAVQQALSLNCVEQPAVYSSSILGHSRMKTFTDVRGEEKGNWNCLDEEDIEELLPELDLLEDVWSNVTLPAEMEKSSDNSANMEELERFCKYIDGDEDETSYDTDHEVKQEQIVHSSRKPKCVRKITAMSRYNVMLENTELWEQFALIGTEMVITKNGRYTNFFQ